MCGFPPPDAIFEAEKWQRAEENLRLAYIANRGDLTVFLTRPISALFVFLTVFSLCWPIYREWKTGKKIPQ